MIAARMNEAPSLLVVHNISLPPGEFGGPWIDALFTGTLDPMPILSLPKSRICAFRRIV
jgi:N-acetyl-anhydromuramyl-L-alanine amidase AmpD